MTPEVKARIDAMERLELCRAWRFAAVGDPLFQGDAGDYFQHRLIEMGGFSVEISKQLSLEGNK